MRSVTNKNYIKLFKALSACGRRGISMLVALISHGATWELINHAPNQFSIIVYRDDTKINRPRIRVPSYSPNIAPNILLKIERKGTIEIKLNSLSRTAKPRTTNFRIIKKVKIKVIIWPM